MRTKQEHEASKAKREAEDDKKKLWFRQRDPIAKFTGWVAIYTLLLFVATIFSAGVLYKTDLTLDRTLKATEKAAHAAQEAAEIARDTMIAANRAWIAPESIELVNPVRINEPIWMRLQYKNAGHGPATDLNSASGPGVIDRPQSFTGFQSLQFAKNDYCDNLKPVDEGPVVYPSDSHILTITTGPLLIDPPIVSGSKIYYIRGCFAYKTLGMARHTGFCRYLDPGLDPSLKKWAFRGCNTGNFSN